MSHFGTFLRFSGVNIITEFETRFSFIEVKLTTNDNFLFPAIYTQKHSLASREWTTMYEQSMERKNLKWVKKQTDARYGDFPKFRIS